METKVYVVTTKTSTEEGHDFSVELVTTSKENAIERMKQEFNNAITENHITFTETSGYDKAITENSMRYYAMYDYEEFEVEIVERTLED